MARSVSVGIDFGTSVVKGTAIDLQSGERHQISDVYTDRSEQASPAGWSLVLERMLHVLAARLGASVRVESLAITAMVPNVALVTRTGQTLGSLLFCDNDAFELELALDARFNSPRWANEVLSKLLLLAENSTGQSFRWFTTHSWLVHDLTGAFVLDSVTAGECGSLVSSLGEWDRNLLQELKLSPDVLPSIVAPASVAGVVRDSYPVSNFRGVPVVAGTSDTIATALGAGWGLAPESLLVYYGTFNCVARLLKGRDDILDGSTPFNPFDWILSVPRAGAQLAHLADLIGEGGDLSTRIASLDAMAAQSQPGANGLVFLHSDDLRKTTVSTPPMGSIRYLQPRHTKGDLARAVLEGFAFLIRWALESAGRSPTSFSSVMAAGGGARSTLWRQIVADTTRLTQAYRPSADRGLGSALLAVSGIDRSALARLGAIVAAETITSLPSDTSGYEAAYRRYLASWT